MSSLLKVKSNTQAVLLLGVLLRMSAYGTVPMGADVGPVQFDVIVSLSPPIASTRMVIFARYWVASDYYKIAIAWAEPIGPEFRFPVYPVSLIVGSDSNKFQLSHDLFVVYNTNFFKPIEPSATFRCMYGDYPIVNLRFAEAEACRERLFDVDLQAQTQKPRRDRAGFNDMRMRTNGNDLVSIQLFDNEHRLLKEISYAYEGSDTKSHLSSESVLLPERDISVGFQRGGIAVRSQAGTERYSDFSDVFEKGGRRCHIDYQTVQLGHTNAHLPAFIEVRDASDGKLLRSCRFTEYRQTAMNRTEAQKAAEEFGKLSPELLEEEQLSRSLGPPHLETIEPEDLQKAQTLRDFFAHTGEPAALGHKFRRLGALRRLNDVLADEPEIERCFHSYLSLLLENQLPDMVLCGGAEEIEAEASFGRLDLAKRLLRHWLDYGLGQVDSDSILCFVRNSAKSPYDWETLEALNRLEAMDPKLTNDSRFEMYLWKYISSTRLLALFEPASISKSNQNSLKAGWAHFISSRAELKQFRDASLAKAKVLYGKTENLTEGQKTVYSQLLEAH